MAAAPSEPKPRWADMVDDEDVWMGGDQARDQGAPENPDQGVPP